MALYDAVSSHLSMTQCFSTKEFQQEELVLSVEFVIDTTHDMYEDYIQDMKRYFL